MSLLGALIARNHRLVAAGLTWIGASSKQSGAMGSEVGANIMLPPGAQAGDVAMLTANTSSADPGLTISSPAVATALEPTNYSSTSAYEYLAAYLYTLTSEDISAGSLMVMTGSSSPVIVWAMDVFRGVSMTPGVVGAVAKGIAAKGATTSMTASGITTLVGGSIAVYVAALRYGGDANHLIIGDAPAGFVLDGNYSTYPSSPQALSHRAPSAAGATGDATMTATLDATYGVTGDWAAVLISLKPVGALTPFALTGTFPDATVGAAWTGVLTFTGDYTGPVVMDVAAGTKPAWIGTPVVDEGAKTATYSGTPDAATSISFTPRATPAVGTPATAAQTFAVAAASAGVDYWDPSRTDSTIALLDSNKTARGGGTGWRSAFGVTASGSGLRYFEIVVSGDGRCMCGVGNSAATTSSYVGSTSDGYGVLTNGNKYNAGSKGASGIGSYSSGDVISITYDSITGSLWFGKNGTISGDPAAGTGAAFTGITGPVFPGFSPESFKVGALRMKDSEFTGTKPSGATSWSGA